MTETRVDISDLSRVAPPIFGRLPWSPNCLERSLVLVRVIRQSGFDPVLRLGVRRHGEVKEFHAWVEVGEEVVGDRVEVTRSYEAFGGRDVPPGAVFH